MSGPFSLNSNSFSLGGFGKKKERIEGKNPVCVKFDLSKKIPFYLFRKYHRSFEAVKYIEKSFTAYYDR